MPGRCAASRRRRFQRRGQGSALAALLVLLFSVFAPSTAQARRNGLVAGSCEGCHGTGATSPVLTMAAEPEVFEPGDWVTFTLNIEFESVRTGGVFITSAGVGNFETVADGGLSINDSGLVHSAPKAATNGVVSFRFSWQAPSAPGGVDFRVVALAADGDGSSRGDTPGSGAFQWAFGCPAQPFYTDLDRDGYGAQHLGMKLDCEGATAPVGYAESSGDCDENNENINPGATEVCNRKDDDCNGEIDENAPAVELWPDEDGDGFYRFRSGTSQVGCGNLPGYAALGGDCDDANVEVNPGVLETCNGRDDNCDGDVDDQVRPRCGVGWCARFSTSCEPEDCSPGPPIQEACNNFDDDCDGVLDNDACPEGQDCVDAECVPASGASPTGPSPTPSQASSPAPGGSAPVSGGPGAAPSSSNEGSVPEPMTSPGGDGTPAGADPSPQMGPESTPGATAEPPVAPTGDDAAAAAAGCRTASAGRPSRDSLQLVGFGALALAAVLRRRRARSVWLSAWHK
jgi:hypothetical protein